MPPGPVAETTAELILRGRFARIPLKVRGSLVNGKLGELSGSVTIEESLEQFLGDLGSRFDSETLKKLIGDSLGGIALDSLAFEYRESIAQVAVTLQARGSRCRFVFLKASGEKKGFVTGLELRLDKSLFSNNPLSGLIGEIRLGDLSLYYANADLPGIAYNPAEDVRNAGELVRTPASIQTRDFTRGINWSAKVSIGEIRLLDWPPVLKAETPAQPARPASVPAKPPASVPEKLPDSTTWIELNKALGPLSVRRIGLSYEAPRVGVKFDATLQLSVLTLTLDGLGVSYPINDFSDLSVSKILKNLDFTLDGMGLALAAGPIEIGGSLLVVKRSPLEIEGTLLIRTAGFSLSAFGSYADLNGTPSVMAYAVLLKALGGPSFFFVTGLAFGFGANRKLRLPNIEEVHTFPLIKAAMGAQGFSDLQKLPRELRGNISPALGSFWIAAGIKFTSFVMIESFALLSVSFGAEVEVGLLGLSRLSIPPLAPPAQVIASAELALRAVIRFADGSIKVEARLTENSYILSRSCRLTGGFAFYLWFSGEHAGDFVVTLGGYHPAFRPPAHYPTVPRLGMHWQISSELSVTGELYFALTPSCLMAGGKLCATFKSGIIEAWFIAYADFLLSWEPLYYSARMGISIGVAFRLKVVFFTISFRLELSVTLELWGPSFGGEAVVSLSVITFSIRFGEPRSMPAPLTADKFIAKCLPPSKVEGVPDVFSLRITAGLLREQKIDETRTDRIVNAHQLSVVAQSVIPCTGFEGLAATAGLTPAPLGVRPMGKTALESKFSVTIRDEAGSPKLSNLRVDTVAGNVPEAVWGKSAKEGVAPIPDKPEAKTIGATVGIRISCIAPEPVNPIPKIPIAKLLSWEIRKKVEWVAPIEIQPYTDRAADTTIFNTIWTEPVKKERDSILNCLRGNGFDMQQPNLEEFSKIEDSSAGQLPLGGYFQEQPRLCALGTKPEKERR
jgi:hypothetical protein